MAPINLIGLNVLNIHRIAMEKSVMEKSMIAMETRVIAMEEDCKEKSRGNSYDNHHLRTSGTTTKVLLT